MQYEELNRIARAQLDGAPRWKILAAIALLAWQGLIERLWRLLPDQCEIPGCSRLGVRGNENIIDGKIVCDYCHAKMMSAEDRLEMRDMQMLQRGVCPYCEKPSTFRDGPKGGMSTNIFCNTCGGGLNVAIWPQPLMFVQRIGDDLSVSRS